MRTTLQFNKTFIHIHSLNSTNGDHLLVVYRKNETIGSTVIKGRYLPLESIVETAIEILKLNAHYKHLLQIYDAYNDLLHGKN